MSNRPLRTKEDVIEVLHEKDRLMKKLGYMKYELRAHQHIVAMHNLIDQHPELREFITEAYEESGLINSRKVLQSLQA
jgi:hypothetical protein